MTTTKTYIDEYTLPVEMTEKPLAVKEWFAAKKFKEIRNSRAYDNRIFAIFAETEKAYNCLVGGVGMIINTWVPKSLVEEYDGEAKRNTFVCDNYTDAKNILDAIRRYYE